MSLLFEEGFDTPSVLKVSLTLAARCACPLWERGQAFCCNFEANKARKRHAGLAKLDWFEDRLGLAEPLA